MKNILNTVNVIGGVAMTALVAVFGQYWFLFVGLLIANIVDWISGWMRSRLRDESCSKIGAIGAMKKVWYWVVIGIAFFVGFSFQRMGQTIGVPLDFMHFVGWFTLANYLVNEIRSILENLVEMEVPVPAFLVKGLRIAAERIETAAEIGGDEDDGNGDEEN